MAALRNGSKCSHTTVYAPLFHRSAFAENLYLINRSEVPPSGGALNPNLVFEIGSNVCSSSLYTP
jgi:hypothetical protein